MLDNWAESETQATSAAERYKAERGLGDKFDVREFHAEVLKDGSVPLDVLEAKIDRWIAEKKG